MSDAPLPGTSAQQALLRAVASHYADDPRVLAVAVFGSLGRGTWDEYSDLDLDVVLADGVAVDAALELRALCDSFASIGERALFIIPDDEDCEGDVVLASLLGLSVRYHPLATTKPAIVDSLRVLAGRLDAQTIRAAGLANVGRAPAPLCVTLDRLVRWLVDADTAVRRRQFWRALQMLQLVREALLEIFARARGAERPFHTFETAASPELRDRLGATLPGYGLPAAQAAFAQMLDVVEHDLEALSAGRLRLSAEHREVIAAIRRRQGP